MNLAGQRHSQHRRYGDYQRPHTEPPVHCKLRHGRLGQRIQAPRHRAPSRLERLVRADKDGRHGGGIRSRAHQPVAKSLPKGVVGPIEDIQENRTGGQPALRVVDVLFMPLGHAPIKPFLERIPPAPDGHAGREEEQPAHPCAVLAVHPRHIEDQADDETAQHLRDPVQGPVQRPRADVEGHPVDDVLLVRVEDIRAEEHGDHAEDPPVRHGLGRQLGRSPPVLLRLGRGLQPLHADGRGRTDQGPEQPADGHDDQQGDVGAVCDGPAVRVVIETKAGERAHPAAEVEDDPEGGDGSAFLGFRHVRRHDGSLRHPQEGRSDPENGTGGDDERAVGGVYRVSIGHCRGNGFIRLKHNRLPEYKE